MKKSQLNELENELNNIRDSKIEVINDNDIFKSNCIPKGSKVYNIECSILFVDIRNSTNMTDTTGRKNMVKVYKMFATLVSKAVSENDGYVRQFIGDGMMCCFVNDDDRNSGEKAISTAITINTYLQEVYNPMMSDEMKINCGIGIRTGHVYVTKMKIRKYELVTQIFYPSSITNYASKFCNLADSGNIIFDYKTYEHLSKELKDLSEDFNLGEYGDSKIMKNIIWKID